MSHFTKQQLHFVKCIKYGTLPIIINVIHSVTNQCNRLEFILINEHFLCLERNEIQ